MSNLEIGIIGLPNVGKSTLFNALTNGHVLAANYPFATIEPNTGIVPVPDPRLGTLAKLYHTDKIIPATVTFVDIAGLVAGASQGEGLGNQFLSHVRSCNTLVHVVRAFDDPNVTHVATQVSPKNDIETINTELILADLQSIEKRLAKLSKEVKANSSLKPIETAAQAARSLLDNGDLLISNPELVETLKDWQLITAKPLLYVFNVDEAGLNNKNLQQELAGLVTPATALFICAKLEDELQSLDESDRDELLASYGQDQSGLIQLIKAAYKLLGLQSYLTAGEKEVRAWTITKDTTAPKAAGVIHGDFERGFIAAQVINYQDLVAAGDEAAAKAAGKVRTEGKDYVMQPDDVVEFRFNV